MIGVAVRDVERAAASELFELCKTPWEFWQDAKAYEVIVASGNAPKSDAPLVIEFNARLDTGARPKAATVLRHGARRIPIYGSAATFPESTCHLVEDEQSKQPVLQAQRIDDAKTRIQVGYSLFGEVRCLLESGQPAEWSRTPTLELHIALLRELITRAGVAFVEIPPVPDGYSFIGCLSHDIDHPLFRNHRFDHTELGFVYRALVGTPLDVLRGKKPPREIAANWAAILRLPFVHLGWAKDAWSEFDRYVAIESGLRSTFFFIPQGNYAGKKVDGPAPTKRASRYEPSELAAQMKKIAASGSEVGLHGLDAWIDPARARHERERIAGVSGTVPVGIRMHWLYFDQNSPAILDDAGFSYDSTVGYNETVGYRAGTSQAYRPPGTKNLLELPLTLMDTALFYPDYLNLGPQEAVAIIDELLGNAAIFGGALTINWHDRSIMPERNWDETYRLIVRRLIDAHAWCPTCADAVAWFRKRRAASVVITSSSRDGISVKARAAEADSLPPLTIRVYKPCEKSDSECISMRTPADAVNLRLINEKELMIVFTK